MTTTREHTLPVSDDAVRLSVDDLALAIGDGPGAVRLVDGVGLEVSAGETLALVGESGCGKSLTALAIMGLLPPSVRQERGAVVLGGLPLRTGEVAARHATRAAMVFQEPMSSLNPVLTVGDQIREVLDLHRIGAAAARGQRVIDLLKQVGIPAAQQRAASYPHQLSGGMRQRVMIAMALAAEPALLIADEPTTALDVTVQAQILMLLRRLQRERGLAVLFISHDLGVVAQVADALAVMYAGRIVERGSVAELFAQPRHPYTEALLRSLPRIERAARIEESAGAEFVQRRERLPVIPGEVPRPEDRPSGCAFHPRCGYGRDEPQCQTEIPPLEAVGGGRATACWKHEQLPDPREAQSG